MISRFERRIAKLEKRYTPWADMEQWRNCDADDLPDWALCSIILDRPVSPEEAAELDEDEEFGRLLDAIASSQPRS